MGDGINDDSASASARRGGGRNPIAGGGRRRGGRKRRRRRDREQQQQQPRESNDGDGDGNGAFTSSGLGGGCSSSRNDDTKRHRAGGGGGGGGGVTVSSWWENGGDVDAEGSKLRTGRQGEDEQERRRSLLLREFCEAILPPCRHPPRQQQPSKKRKMTEVPAPAAADPTPIQFATWNRLLLSSSSSLSPPSDSRRKRQKGGVPSSVLLAPTGSGKTIAYTGAFLLSLLLQQQQQQQHEEQTTKQQQHEEQTTKQQQQRERNNCLVVVPTRELAMQVADEMRETVGRVTSFSAATAATAGDDDATASSTSSSSGDKSQSPLSWLSERLRRVEVVCCYGGGVSSAAASADDDVDDGEGGPRKKRKSRNRRCNHSSKISGSSRQGQRDALLRAASASVGYDGDADQQGKNKGQRSPGLAIVVGTPGRLLDLFQDIRGSGGGGGSVRREVVEEEAVLGSFGYVIFDEADRLAVQTDICRQVDSILDLLLPPPAGGCNGIAAGTTTRCLASATMPAKVKPKWNSWIGKDGDGDERRECVFICVDALSMAKTPPAGAAAAASKCNGTGGDDSGVRKAEGAAGNGEDGSAARQSAEGATDPPTATGDDADGSGSPHLNSSLMSQIPSHLKQALDVCAEHKKPRKLLHTLRQKVGGDRKGLGIVFFNKIKTLKATSTFLQKQRIQFLELHSHMHQQEREKAIRTFKSGRVPLLLATDLAARGLHSNHVNYVVNYDFPGNLQTFVHRCGRAGRGQQHRHHQSSGGGDDDRICDGSGKRADPTVYSFFTRNLAPLAADMVQLLRACNQRVDPNLLALVLREGQGPGADGISGNADGANNMTDDKDKKRKNRKLKRREHEREAESQQKKRGEKKDIQKSDEVDSDDCDWKEDDFPELSSQRIVLKRAGHVSDASSDSGEED